MLAEEESGEVLVAAQEVNGFFIDPEAGLPQVVFHDVGEVNQRIRRTADAVLKVIGRGGRQIGEYSVGTVVVGDVQVASPGRKGASVAFRTFQNRCAYPAAAGVWRRWTSGEPLEPGEWCSRPVSDLEAWLDVVQNSWFATGRRVARYGVGDVVRLDGSRITTKEGFYLTLGEAVHGPGGYYGSNLDALADFLSSEVGETPPVQIVWQDFEVTRRAVDEVHLTAIMEVLREFGVVVVTRRN
ncbi:barstar family protein [Actinosynnema sp. NPDC050436]|uniref:barstar family protein n=1 Tax=Actinosynnema sp. NPDC050436 TaxID=3155659 RepID=UPI0033E4BB9B